MIGHLIVTAAMPLLLQTQQTSSGNMTSEQEFQVAMEALKHSGDFGEGVTGVLALLVPFALFAMVFGIVWLKHRQRQAQMQAQAEFHKQLLDKFGSGKEFAEFLESKGSRRFLDEMKGHGGGRLDQVLRTMRIGVVTTVLGLGMFVFREEREIAVVVLALGVGFLASSAISYRLSKRWGEKTAGDVHEAS